MSRAFLKDKHGKAVLTPKLLEKIKNLPVKDGKNVGEEYFNNEIAPYYNSPFFNTAARLVRFFAAKHFQFMSELSHIVGKEYWNVSIYDKIKYFPLCVPVVRKTATGENTVNVIVFDNIQVNLDAGEDNLRNVSWATFGYVLKSLLNTIRDDKNDAKAKAKWEPTSRGIKLIKRHNEMTMAKFITNYTNIASVQSTAKIRDLAVTLEEPYVPLEIVFATQPEHYIEMYEKGPSSCMSGKDGREWTSLKKDKSFHPTLWYLHNPQTQGIYARKSGKVLARTIACLSPTTKKWMYTRIYSSNDMAKKQMMNTLKEMGVDPVTSFTCSQEFTVPGVSEGPDFISPMPYLDHINPKWHVTFNKVTNEFLFSPKGEPNIQGQAARGFIRASELTLRTCAHCRNKLGLGQASLNAVDGTVFCSGPCMLEHHYVQAYRSDGAQVIVPKAEIFVDALNATYKFTNKEACVARGGLPAIVNFVEPEDDSVLSVDGYEVHMNDTKYRIRVKDFDFLVNKGLAVKKGYIIKSLNKREMPIYVEIVNSMRINEDTGRMEVA